MSLKVELKPNERVIIGDCVITNGGNRTRLLIDGAVAILREKDILTPAQADTPAKRVYLAVQLMYTSRDPSSQHETYFALMRDLIQAAPSAWPHVEAINNHILAGEMYKAIKAAGALISYEKELLDHATGRKDVRQGREAISRAAGT